MIVTLKTLQQQTFKVEIGEEETVKALKEKVEAEKGKETFPAAGQKLIYAGKILDDEKPISTYKIEEKNFVVVMVTKPKPAAASSPASGSGAVSTSPVTESKPVSAPLQAPQPVKAETKPEAEKSEPPSNTTSSTDTTATESSSNVTTASSETASESQSASSVQSQLSTESAESALVTGQLYEEAVAQMVSMGFPRDQVQRAMRASFNNPDRAVEYLFNGIPEMPRDEPTAAASQQSTGTQPQSPRSRTQPGGTGQTGAGGQTGTTSQTAPQPSAGGTGSAGTLSGPPPGARLSGEETLAFLRNQPQFQHMRQLLQQNPALLPELLQQIGRSNPTLLQMISQNQEQFIAMLNETPESVGGGGGGQRAGPGEGVIHVTQEEKEAIDRLKALGFPEGICIQAYFACEKNEELAANYLLSHGFDDEDS